MNTKKNSNIMTGARILMAFFVLLFFLLFARLLYIQATKQIEGKALTAFAEEKWTKTRQIEAKRGMILDRNGEVIAKDAPSFTIYAILDESYTKDPDNPNHVTDPYEAAEKLSPILNVEKETLVRYLSKDGLFQTELGSAGRNISQQLKDQIEAMDIPGIRFMRSTKRYYPNGVFASHITGYVNESEDDLLIGQMGIEQTMDEYLRGQAGKVTYQSDRRGMKLPDPREMVVPPENGHNVYLTIDQKIQTFVESALTYVQNEYEPEKMMVIVADPKSGEILAMGNRPSFDPNKRDIQNYLNDTVAYRFEPGSTMKVFTLAAAVNEGVFNPEETYQSGQYRFSSNERPIRDHNNGLGWGEITYLEGVQRSSNVAFAKLVDEKLGADSLLMYINRFGFHKKTEIDVPGEVSGNILYRYRSEKLTTAFGQGTAVTPIQQIQAATAIANDGKMMKPYVIKKIVDPETGEVKEENKSQIVGEPITEDTANEVRKYLETVVTAPEGTGKRFAIEGYGVAGKTGTAQIPDPKTGKYMNGHGNNIFSFIGMAPTDDPKLLVYVAVKQPKIELTEAGSEVVSYIFRNVMKNSLHYLNVEPSATEDLKQPVAKEGITINSYIGGNTSSIVEKLKGKGLEVFVLGTGQKIAAQIPYPSSKVLPGDKVILKADGEMKMPDLSGWSLREVMKLSYLLDLKPNLIGYGYVNKQNIDKGTVLKEGDYLVVELSPPITEEESQKAEGEDEKEEEESFSIPEEFEGNIGD